MENINNDDFRRLDLNLLLPFVVVCEEGGVTRAAERLYLTQPAVSAALQRLREAVGDDLFVREGRGLRPNPRAQALFEAAREALGQLHRAVYAPSSFAPSEANQVFVLGMSDDADTLLTPLLMERMARLAPGVRLMTRPVNFRSAREVLDDDGLDLAISVFDELPPHIARERLFESPFVGLHSPAQLTLPDPLTLEAYLSLNHVIVSYNGDFRGIVEDQLGPTQPRRQVKLALSGFAAVPYVLQSAPLVATLPATLARRFASQFGLTSFALPLPIQGQPVEMVWPRRKDADPAHEWLRAQISEVVSQTVTTV